ncbi:MAG: GMC family oxidoreductase [Rhodobiaceae bacterium]|nr:GMC family oxidoreductase [Rhodobiaceae bacterium]MCC0060586.1 GMC family oxidoreductase [Rhodobiaceae bacterium]
MSYRNFIDARQVETGELVQADVCIIGGGAAGTTLARQFAGSQLRVVLLEAGGMNIDPKVNRQSTVTDIGRNYGAEAKRLRYFGGTTNHWGGQCLPLEPDDFERKEWIEHSGWPYGYDELEPYYERAHALMKLGPFDYRPGPLAAALGLETFPFDPGRVRTTMAKYNRFRFGLEFADEIGAAKNIQTFIYADVTGLEFDDAAGQSISTVNISTIAGNSFAVKSRVFILAAGGIENARLLLISNTQRPMGIGNHSDCVGRYFMDHLWYPSGLILPGSGKPSFGLYLSEIPYQGYAVRCHLNLSHELTQALRLTKYRSELGAVDQQYYRLWHLYHRGPDAGDIMHLIADPFATGQALKCRSDTPPGAYLLKNYVEQTPNPASRVMLSGEKDMFGRSQTDLDWQISAQDHNSVVAAQIAIAQEVGRSGFGRARIDIGKIAEDSREALQGCGGGAHHMGTTRMSANPANGVADGDARVHATNNLYIAGSSLFPTGGCANPTLTIIAMTLRLADHLRIRFEKEGII